MKQVNFYESQTMKNLAKSFASECMEGAKYQFIAQQCVQEKLNYLQTIFKTLAKHEMSHAKVFWDLLHEQYEGTIDNIDLNFGYPFDCTDLIQSIECHIKNEADLSDNIYPLFAKVAKDEGFEEIAHKFELIATVENCHSELLKQLHEKLMSNSLYKCTKNIKWKCGQCGFEHTAKTPPTPCPLCENEQGYYEVYFDMGE